MSDIARLCCFSIWICLQCTWQISPDISGISVVHFQCWCMLRPYFHISLIVLVWIRKRRVIITIPHWQYLMVDIHSNLFCKHIFPLISLFILGRQIGYPRTWRLLWKTTSLWCWESLSWKFHCDSRERERAPFLCRCIIYHLNVS